MELHGNEVRWKQKLQDRESRGRENHINNRSAGGEIKGVHPLLETFLRTPISLDFLSLLKLFLPLPSCSK